MSSHSQARSRFDAWENNFDFIRFCFASLVILSHTWPLNLGSDAPDPLGRIVMGRSLGEVAVDGFFVISGFLIAGSWSRSKSLWDYLKKRVHRIYPAFIALMLIQAFVVAPLLAEGEVHRYSAHQLALIFGEMLDLVGYGYPYGGLYTVLSHNPVPELNGALWTIRYEFVCYLILAALGLLGVLRRRPVLLGLFALVLALHASHIVLPSTKLVTAALGATASWPRLLCYFLAGATFHAFRDRIPHSTALAATACLGLPICAFLPASFDLLLPLCGSYLIFWVAMLPGSLNHFGRHGDFSYGIYLYGFPIAQLIVRSAASWPFAVQFLCAWLLAILCGIASWFLVERRFLRRGTVERIESRAAKDLSQ